MNDLAVVFDHVYKKFARGEQHTSLRDFIPAMAGKFWPFGKKKIADGLKEQEFWAVQDLSFSLKRGETLGIIGPNGSGKSTTLKLLSGILRPERGTYTVKGRLSALIEVGAGFHPDLTGRENVFLNGSILGMTRKEVASKFNDIIDFAGVDEFIDTPVKRYSSGMAVRLGFAVAAMVEPDVLLVDEVLAVGDTEFRARCHARMEQMRRNGVTMILVSHNLPEVRNLCERALMLYKGQEMQQGPTLKVIEQYHKTVAEKINIEQTKLAEKEKATAPPRVETGARITSVQLLDGQGQVAGEFGTKYPMTVRIAYDTTRRIERPQAMVELLWANDDFVAAIMSSEAEGITLNPIEGRGTIDLRIPRITIEPNVYSFRISIIDGQTRKPLDSTRARFIVNEGLPMPGIFGINHSWEQPRPSVTKDGKVEAA